MNDFTIVSPTSIYASGQLYSYDTNVTLTPQQFNSGQLAHDFRISQNLAQARGIEPDKQDFYSLQGTLSEVAFYVSLNLPGYRIDLGKECDARIVKGKTTWEVDVKASYRPNLLVAKRHLEEHPDWIYCNLQQLSRNQFRLIGWLEGSEVKKRSGRTLTNGRPPAYLVPYSRLNCFRAKIGAPLNNLSF